MVHFKTTTELDGEQALGTGGGGGQEKKQEAMRGLLQGPRERKSGHGQEWWRVV